MGLVATVRKLTATLERRTRLTWLTQSARKRLERDLASRTNLLTPAAERRHCGNSIEQPGRSSMPIIDADADADADGDADVDAGPGRDVVACGSVVLAGVEFSFVTGFSAN
jgi:hypothetical protein